MRPSSILFHSALCAVLAAGPAFAEKPPAKTVPSKAPAPTAKGGTAPVSSAPVTSGKLLDKAAAEKAIQEKQQLEVSLAWELLEVFNDKSNGLIDPLREFASLALLEMVGFADQGSPADKEAVQEAINDEKAAMALLLKDRGLVKVNDKGQTVKKGIESASELKLLLKEVDAMDASYVSDVVRLYGAFVEKMNVKKGEKPTDTQKKWVELNRLKDEYRKGTGLSPDKDDASQVWNKGDAKEAFGRHRKAILGDDVKTRLETMKKMGVKENLIEAARVRFLAEAAATYEKSSRGATQSFLVSMKGGQSVFALKNSSTLGRIDKAFGLVPAADISGTTADNIFFLSNFGGGTHDKIFEMLPLATIVAGAHHSTIEVALPLSQNKLIDYDIGLYSTLMPVAAKHPAKAKVASVLKKAEDEANNHHLLVFYGPGCKAVEGAYEFSAKDKAFAGYRKLAKATSTLAAFASKDGKDCLDKAAAEKMIKDNKL